MEIRTTKPKAGNKFYITKSAGGYSTCIKGSPTDSGCNVLANCVGYTSGRFNEIIGTYKYTTLNCNAEYFIERAKKAGLEIGTTPKVGAIICWQKGKLDDGSDGAGHVAVVEKVNSDGSIYLSESAWKGSAFYNTTRTNKNGRWGQSSAYTFRGFIYNPAIPDEPEPQPTPQPTDKLKVGDKVIIKKTGNGSSYGTSNTAYGIGWKREILAIYEGRKYPYQIGNKYGTTGFYQENALEKY